jgi:diguanylate cyclase (GGDEF)-like protein/PAS domain S-box-containing protein
MPLFARRGSKRPPPLHPAHLRALLAESPLAAAVLDADGQALAANAAMTALLGWGEPELTGFGLLERVYGPDADDLRERFGRLAKRRTETLRSKQRWVRQSGEIIWCRAGAHQVPLDSASDPVIVLTLEDISEQVRLEDERWDAETELKIQRAVTTSLASAPSANEAITSVLQAICQASGWAIGLFWTADQADEVLHCTHNWHATSVESQLFVAAVRKRPLPPQSGPPVDAWQQGMPIWTPDVAAANRSLHLGKAQDAGLSSAVSIPLLLQSGVYGVLEFLSWQKQPDRPSLTASLQSVATQLAQALERIWAEHPLREREARYRAIAEMAGEGIITIDEHSSIMFVNAAAERIFGYTRAELVGQSMTMLMPEALREGHLAGMRRYVQTGRKRVQWDMLEFPGLHKNGEEIALEMSVADVGDGHTGVFTGFIRDVTERRKEESALVYQALHDALTDLPNRNLLQERLTRAVLVAHRHSAPLALLFMDLDRFKDVNDTFGHHCGDVLLQQVAQRLQGTVRESDTVARLGGDEFAVLLPTTDERGAQLTARRLLDALEAHFKVEGQSFQVGASIGIAYYPQHGGDAATLMRRADVAMYAAKRSGSGFATYTADRDEMSSLRLLLTGELRQAIENNHMVLHYQPKVNLRDGRTENVEALIRWQHPERGLTSPDGFIPLAEETGLMKPLTIWVLNEALRQHREWREAGLFLRVAVNFSARVLHDPELFGIVETALKTWDVEPSSLEVEITESAIMVDPERAKETLTALHTMGILTSIDDFGTGHSSLAYLRRLPFDEIKIDKSFVLDMATSRDDRSIVQSVIALGHNFDLHVVAEGVDNQRTLDMLGKMGCDMAQGYFLSRPVAAGQLVAWLQDPQRRLSIAS